MARHITVAIVESPREHWTPDIWRDDAGFWARVGAKLLGPFYSEQEAETSAWYAAGCP